MSDNSSDGALEQLGINVIRGLAMDAPQKANAGHPGTAMALAPLAHVLWTRIMNYDPTEPDWPDRDMFVLSKGHGALALYAVLAERGFLDAAELDAYGRPGSRLLGHPVRTVPGVELPTGSLGHGLALGLGFAVAGRLAGSTRRTVVVTGDGELQEGSCWEAAGCAGALRADRLVAVIVENLPAYSFPHEAAIHINGHTFEAPTFRTRLAAHRDQDFFGVYLLLFSVNRNGDGNTSFRLLNFVDLRTGVKVDAPLAEYSR